MNKTLKYRDKSYFNDIDTYLFNGTFKKFESKVHFEKGHWWTNENLKYKATSVKSIKL